MTKPRRKIGQETLAGIRQLKRGRIGRVTTLHPTMKSRYDFSCGRRGAVDPVPDHLTYVSIPVDIDVLEWFRQAVHAAGGGNYLTLMNEALRAHVAHQCESLEDLFRRVIREEMSRSRSHRKSRAKP